MVIAKKIIELLCAMKFNSGIGNSSSCLLLACELACELAKKFLRTACPRIAKAVSTLVMRCIPVSRFIRVLDNALRFL